MPLLCICSCTLALPLSLNTAVSRNTTGAFCSKANETQPAVIQCAWSGSHLFLLACRRADVIKQQSIRSEMKLQPQGKYFSFVKITDAMSCIRCCCMTECGSLGSGRTADKIITWHLFVCKVVLQQQGFLNVFVSILGCSATYLWAAPITFLQRNTLLYLMIPVCAMTEKWEKEAEKRKKNRVIQVVHKPKWLYFVNKHAAVEYIRDKLAT